jgi:two-component system sensor histidine kinase KdpD
MASRAETEALRRSDALKTTLLRAMSHDLRSPLTAIMTSASALAEAELLLDDADRRELSETILEEAMRLDRLVSNLLDLSRLDAGAISTELDVCPIDVLLARAMNAVQARRRIDLSLPEEPVLVHADPHQIERVLVNLIENALHHSPLTEPVYVRVRRTRSEAFVRVIDHGPGIAPDELEQIFEPFQRGSRTGGVRGAGLGLAIARGFADANGGRVWAESLDGQGAAFVLALPLAERRT